MYKNTIVIEGGSTNKIKKALNQWIESSCDNFSDDFEFKLYKVSTGKHILVDNYLDNIDLFSLINYLFYPEDISYEIEIFGYTRGTSETILKDKDLLVYISLNVPEPDYVNIVTKDNEHYKYIFNGTITNVIDEEDYYLEDLQLNGNPQIISFNKEKILKKQLIQSGKETKKRIKLFIILVTAALILSYFLISIPGKFIALNTFIATGIFIYILFDYELLRKTQNYFTLFVFSIILCLYGYFLKIKFEELYNIDYFIATIVMPVTLLIFQRPARFLFMLIFNREPIVDRTSPSVPDFIYMMILIAIPLIILFYINETAR